MRFKSLPVYSPSRGVDRFEGYLAHEIASYEYPTVGLCPGPSGGPGRGGGSFL